jgi:hypothetical protein
MTWLVKRDGHETSISDVASLRDWARKGGLKRGDLVFHPDLQRWLYAHEVLELNDLFRESSAPSPPTRTHASANPEDTHRLNAVVLAKNYRQLVGAFGLQLVLSMFIWSDTLTLLMLPAIVGTSVALAYFSYRTAESLGSQSAALWAVAMFVPCISMITLLALSSRATTACRAMGIEVGLFGPKV